MFGCKCVFRSGVSRRDDDDDEERVNEEKCCTRKKKRERKHCRYINAVSGFFMFSKQKSIK